MDAKSRYRIRILVGIYLIYLGGGLIKQVVIDGSQRLILGWGVGLLFLVVGAGYGIYAFRKIRELEREADVEAEFLEEELEDAFEEDAQEYEQDVCSEDVEEARKLEDTTSEGEDIMSDQQNPREEK
jgi:uncharacterized protein HemX